MPLYQISVYVPEDYVESVKSAMFDAGAGRIGHYEKCAWQTKGVGQFQPLEAANPSIGKCHQLEKVVEYKVEMVCTVADLSAIVEAMKVAHPYETVAYNVLSLIDI